MLACFAKYHCRSMNFIRALKPFTVNGNGNKPFLLLLLAFITFTACSTLSNSQLLHSCTSATDCGPGLYCGNCPSLGKTQPFCIRGQAIMPTSILEDKWRQSIQGGFQIRRLGEVSQCFYGLRYLQLSAGVDLAIGGMGRPNAINGLPFNKYTWLVTHNAFSIVDAPSLTGTQRITFYNQEDTVTNQLRNGVRGLMLDMYDFEDDIWLCHSFHGQCYNFTAFEPVIDTLKEVEAFLNANPTEIVTIIIEDYVHVPKGLTKVFTNAGLDKYWFPLSKMPKKGEEWPTVTDMIKANHRLLVFTSDSSKEATEGIAYQWKHMVENESGDPGVVPGSCPNRKESKPLNSRSASLFLQNYFPTIPDQNQACKEHSVSLLDMVNTCYKAAGNVMPNFLAVNFYMRSDGGGVFDALDRMNGQTLCGCSTVTACQAGASFGSCKDIPTSNTTPATTSPAGSFSGSVQLTGAASTIQLSSLMALCLHSMCIMLLLL